MRTRPPSWGVGVFAGGPYMCAGHSNYTACMYNATISSGQLSTMQADLANWSGNKNDALSNVARQKVFLWVGSSDTTVGPNPMAAVKTQYGNNGVTAANLSFNELSGAAHTFPTDFAGSGDNACGTASSPYISNCSYDGAGAMLKQFYGTLAARNDAPASANYIQFDQTPYTAANPGMAATGWIYVPADCASGTQCRLHVALHGCLQNYATVGADFIQNTGYTRWADTNHIIVLFPQTQVDNTSRLHLGQRLAAQSERLLGLDRLVRHQLRAEGRRAGRRDQGDGGPRRLRHGQRWRWRRRAARAHRRRNLRRDQQLDGHRLGRRQRRERLQRLSQRRQGQPGHRHRDELHRHRPRARPRPTPGRSPT